MPEGTLERGAAMELDEARTPRAAKLGAELAILVTEDEPGVGSPAGPSVEVVGVDEIEGLELTDLKSLVREKLAPLDREAREAILAKLVEVVPPDGKASFELSASLYGIREVLRERLPDDAVVLDPSAGVGGFVLEPLLIEDALKDDIKIEDGDVVRRVRTVGVDVDASTHILAKANTLIHLAELLREPTTTQEALNRVMANTFVLMNTNETLGALENPRGRQGND